ncbi:MAG: transporter [Paenibacillaceae bacterium ZCTH02-B3]|nr:MAG: transporter [Paenibacillaceae bacterium ZCTH02-B3]
MHVFAYIFWNNVLPLAVVIAAGILLQRLFRLDIRTLSKMNFHLFSPVVIFRLLYETDIAASLFGRVILFVLLFEALQFALAESVARLRGLRDGKKAAMRNSVLFYNSANYGLPLNQLVFRGDPYTQSVQILVMMTQSLLPNTYGIYSVNAHRFGWRRTLKVIAAMPVIYAIPLAIGLRAGGVELPVFLYTPLNYLADGFFGFALFTLGAQLGNMPWRITKREALDVSLATAMRLAGGPALAWLVTWMLGIDGLLAAALIVSSAVPTSLSSALIAVEFRNEPEFASQTVLVSTLLSMVTVTLVIQLIGIA